MKIYNISKFFIIFILSLAISNCTIRIGNSKNNKPYDYNNPPECPYQAQDDTRECINGKLISDASRVSWFDFSNVGDQDLEISYFIYDNYEIAKTSKWQNFILGKKSNFRLDITNTSQNEIDIIIFKIKNNKTKELLLNQIGDNYLRVPSWFFDISVFSAYISKIELNLFNENYIFGDNVKNFIDEIKLQYIAYRVVELSATTLQNNSLSIPRKLWLNNNWATGSIRVELIEKDFDFQSATPGQALTWKTYSTTTIVISSSGSAVLYQTRLDYTGPLYYKIFDANTNSLLLESVVRGYPIESETNLSKLNWQKRLTTTQIKSIYYPYEYEYFADFGGSGGEFSPANF